MYVNKSHKNYIDHTNVSDDHFIFFNLCKKGYGTFVELESLPCEIVLDMLEHAAIVDDIEKYEYDQAMKGIQ